MRRSARLSWGRRLFRGAALAVAVIGTSAALSSPALAGKILFGTEEYLRKIEDTAIKGRNGEALYLGHKISYHAFIGPYRVTDDGYILGVVGESKRYYPLDAALIEKLQAQKLLPS